MVLIYNVKHLSSEHFLQTQSHAPALNRGLALIALLSEGGPENLENLTKAIGLPKASVFRLLQSLEKVGCIAKRENKYYEALWRLEPCQSPTNRVVAQLDRLLPELVNQCQHTVEWYTPTPQGLRLERQLHPDSEVHVIIRPGYIRPWAPELDAVTTLGYAFYTNAPIPAAGLKAYQTNGKLSKLTKSQIQQQISSAKKSGSHADSNYNSNSVRRAAVAVLDDSNNELIGIIAVAQYFQFEESTPIDQLIQNIQSILN